MGRVRSSHALVLSAAAAGVAAGVAVQRNHVRSVARDPELAELSTPLGGRPLAVCSPDGTRLYAEEFGPADGPAVVLAHGWTERLSFWGPVIRELCSRDLRVIAYDLRGHGRSDAAIADDYSWDRFGADVEAVLAQTGQGGAHATVVGHSLGAMAIVAWARRHDVRARARAAVLVNTGLGDLTTAHLLLGGLAARFANEGVSRAVLRSRARVPAVSSPAAHALIRFVAFGPTATTGQLAFYERMLIECPADVRAACGLALSDINLYDAVARLTVPTLVVAGDMDRLTPPVHSARIAAALPEPAGLIELEQTGHMSPLERPAALADAIATMARDQAAASPVTGVG
jgi:pimeloyl-ACP methyl ester carboxylesterase